MKGLNNMRKLKLGVFVSAFMLLMSSCDRVTSHYVESYIMGYELYDGIHAYTATSTDGGIKGIGLSPSIYLIWNSGMIDGKVCCMTPCALPTGIWTTTEMSDC